MSNYQFVESILGMIGLAIIICTLLSKQKITRKLLISAIIIVLLLGLHSLKTFYVNEYEYTGFKLASIESKTSQTASANGENFFVVGEYHSQSEDKDFFIVYTVDEDGLYQKKRFPADEVKLKLTDDMEPQVIYSRKIVGMKSNVSFLKDDVVSDKITKTVLVVPKNTIKVQNIYSVQ